MKASNTIGINAKNDLNITAVNTLDYKDTQIYSKGSFGKNETSFQKPIYALFQKGFLKFEILSNLAPPIGVMFFRVNAFGGNLISENRIKRYRFLYCIFGGC